MADAAGAVRRTPRPTTDDNRIPDLREHVRKAHDYARVVGQEHPETKGWMDVVMAILDQPADAVQLGPVREDNRIDQIRAVLEYVDAHEQPSPYTALRRIRAILDSPTPECSCFVVPEERWTRHYDATEPGSMIEQNPDCPVHPAAPPAPRVFFPGDLVPAGLHVMIPIGEVISVDAGPWRVSKSNGPAVEVTGAVPSSEEWQATVDRAHRQRLDEATTQPHLDRAADLEVIRRAEREENQP